MPTIEQAKTSDYAAWDEFLEHIDCATLFHTSKWGKILEDTSKKFKFLLILAKDDSDQILGGFPLVKVNHAPLLSSLISVPFGDGGVICPDRIIYKNLCNYDFDKHLLLVRVIQSQNHNIDLEAYAASGFECFDNGCSYYLDLLQTLDEIWMNYDKRMRTAVRKAKTDGVIIRESDSLEDLAAIDELYQETMRRTGGTLQLLPLLKYLYKNRDAKQVRFFIAEYKTKTIAFSALLLFNKSAYYWLAGSSRDSQKQNPNNLLQHFSIEWLKANGFSQYCLGGGKPRRVEKKDGLDMFKRGWGGDAVPTYLLKRYLNPLGRAAEQMSSLRRR